MSKVILDNGGGITLHLDNWAHYYDGVGDSSEQAGRDLIHYLELGTADGFEGHEEDAVPDQSAIVAGMANGGYNVVPVQLEIDARGPVSMAGLAGEINQTGGAAAKRMFAAMMTSIKVL